MAVETWLRFEAQGYEVRLGVPKSIDVRKLLFG